MIEIGTLIRGWGDVGIVVDHWLHNAGREYECHPVVKWLSGQNTGKTDAIWGDNLEIIA